MASLVDEDVISKASFNNLAYGLTQVATLRRLESGQSTQNVNVLSRIVSDADSKLFRGTEQTPSVTQHIDIGANTESKQDYGPSEVAT